MSPRRARALPLLLAGAACVALARLGARTFAGPATPRGVASPRVVRRGLLDSLDFKKVEEMMKDPEKLKQMQADVEKMMADPEKKKAFEESQMKMQSAVEDLRNDPEMKDFFEDVQKNGFEALKKYESDPRILRKFSAATGGVPGFPGMDQAMAADRAGGMPPAPPPAAAAAVSYKPGDEVFIRGLTKAPELNGKKAMVVPPTAEERKTLEGTGRLIVRLLDSGEQFAVKPDNLLTSAQEADAAMSGSLEDVSLYNPAIQTEAAKLRESGALDDLQNDPELKPVFEDIRKNGMAALEKYWSDDKVMAKISKVMGSGGMPPAR